MTPTPAAHCAVLVPVSDRLEPECEEALATLSKRGYEVRRMLGHSAIDMARCLMAQTALDDGFEELMWIDGDVGFEPDAVDLLRAHGRPIACGIYPKKGQRSLACHVEPGTREIVFGEKGGLVPLRYAATGFLHTRRAVYERIAAALALPRCNARFGKAFYPWFQPLVIPDEGGHWYLGEDYAFCERARQAGFSIVADTTIRLRHVGRYAYTWEDAGGDPPRYASYRLVLDEEASR